MEWLKQEWPRLVVAGLIETAIGLIAFGAISVTVDNSDIRDIGIVSIWVAVILGGAAFLVVRMITTSDLVRREDVPRIIKEKLRTGPPIPIEESEPEEPRIETRVILRADNWVHVEVRNSGPTDQFVAKVIDVYPDSHTVPWSIKWRDVDTEERRILQDDVALLDLATFELPAIKAASEMADDDEDGIPAFMAAVTSGRYRLYSVSQPSGFDFRENQMSYGDELGFDPVHIRIRIAAVNQPTLYIETTFALSFQAYVREDGSPGCKPDISVHEEFHFGEI